ncbi:MAG TPA: endolytic transglycosylase MltG [Candidatus Limnocylindria bacterium]|nr:endolytic transglycosylase MltG [Candidatus Limnocylindria bacterium]
MIGRARVAAVAAGLAATALVAGGLWVFVLPGPSSVGPVVLAVREGQRFGAVADELAELRVVRSAAALTLWARLAGRDRQVAWGDYLLQPPLTPRTVLDRLARPPDPIGLVTIPEGLTTEEVITVLVDRGRGSRSDFEAVLRDPEFLAREGLPADGAEGYLFPDTYVFPSTMTPERIVREMLARFRSRVGSELLARGAARGLTPHQVVTLASLIEEETRLPEERRLVSAVFHNRLRLGMRLQSDPTVLYGRPSGERRITRADLARATAHNTYAIAGLPPTPISNPGLGALEAAVDPAESDALYFVARGDGSHEFTATLAAHNAAVARYQR